MRWYHPLLVNLCYQIIIGIIRKMKETPPIIQTQNTKKEKMKQNNRRPTTSGKFSPRRLTNPCPLWRVRSGDDNLVSSMFGKPQHVTLPYYEGQLRYTSKSLFSSSLTCPSGRFICLFFLVRSVRVQYRKGCIVCCQQ